MTIINTYVAASHATRSKVQDKTSLPDQHKKDAKETRASVDHLDRLIKHKKRLIKEFKAVYSKKLSQLNDRDRFNAELRKEKNIRRIGFAIAFIIPVLIITALCLFAPAVIPTISYLIAKCVILVGQPYGLGLFCAALLFTPVLYFYLICGIRKVIKSILSKDIFSEKQEIEYL